MVAAAKGGSGNGCKMKRSNIGIQDIATFENAESAYRKVRKCKRYREEVLRFTDNLEEELYGPGSRPFSRDVSARRSPALRGI